MRTFFVAIIVLCGAYLLGGFIATLYDWFLKDDYLTYAGVVGALASVIGLLSLIRSSRARIDVERTEADTLESIAQLVREFHELREEKAKAEGEIEELDAKRREMEVLVRKASLSLFLREQLSHHERRILSIVDTNSDLSKHLKELRSTSGKLTALEEEIKVHPNVSLLQEVIESAREDRPTDKDIIADLPPHMRFLYQVLRLTLNSIISIR